MDRTEANYAQFVAELTRISRQYGVAITSTGGVVIADDPAEFADLTYFTGNDGDIFPNE